MTMNFQILDLSHARNVYAVGDIHGHFSLLEEKLAKVGFDPNVDHLVSVGDLVDRGPENERCVEFCQQEWFHWVRGNHEDMMRVVASNAANPSLRNGQKWLETLTREALVEMSDMLNDAPIILEVITPSGKRCGFVHACFPSDDWRHAELIADEYAQICMWDRTDVHSPKPNGISHIDYVFHGHTPLAGPRTVANVVWIDTGAFRDGGSLTIARCP